MFFGFSSPSKDYFAAICGWGKGVKIILAKFHHMLLKPQGRVSLFFIQLSLDSNHALATTRQSCASALFPRKYQSFSGFRMFEVDDIGNDGDDDLSHHYLPNFKQLKLGF